MRINSLDLFAPVALVAFQGLEAHLRRTSRFRCFETYRPPDYQLEMVRKGTSRAHPFLSAHQIGLGADFVPYGPNGWLWPRSDDPEWDYLSKSAKEFGLRTAIPWDRPHVEHPAYASVLPYLKRRAG
jgi:hypothetical protein